MARRRSSRLGDEGAATVEFALLLPVLLVILFGIIECGRGFNMLLSMSHGAREGVRVLALNQDTGLAVDRAREAMFPVPADGTTITPTACPAVPGPTDRARMTVTRTYDYVTPLGAMLQMAAGGGALATPSISGRGEMRCTG